MTQSNSKIPALPSVALVWGFILMSGATTLVALMLAAVILGGHAGSAAVPGLLVGGITAVMFAQFWRASQLRKHSYAWYAKNFPRYAEPSLACRHCGSNAVAEKRFFGILGLQVHICSTCDETLFYSST